jgi:hypothetical protein
LSLFDFKDVVFWFENVLNIVEEETEVGHLVKVGAVTVDSDILDKLVNDELWSDKEGSS